MFSTITSDLLRSLCIISRVSERDMNPSCVPISSPLYKYCIILRNAPHRPARHQVCFYPNTQFNSLLLRGGTNEMLIWWMKDWKNICSTVTSLSLSLCLGGWVQGEPEGGQRSSGLTQRSIEWLCPHSYNILHTHHCNRIWRAENVLKIVLRSNRLMCFCAPHESWLHLSAPFVTSSTTLRNETWSDTLF